MGGSEGGGEGGGSISAKLLCLLTGDIPFDESFGFFVVFEAYLISSSSRVSSSTRGHQSDPSFIFFPQSDPLWSSRCQQNTQVDFQRRVVLR